VKKTFRTCRPWKGKSWTSEANLIGPPKSLSQKTTTSKKSTRKRRNYNTPTIESNRECNRSEPRSGEKGFSIVGQELMLQTVTE